MITFLLGVWNIMTALWDAGNYWGRILVIFLISWFLFFMTSLMLTNGALQFVISSVPIILIAIVAIFNWGILPERVRALLILVGLWSLVLWLISLANPAQPEWLIILLSVVKTVLCLVPFVVMTVVLIDVWDLNPRWMRILSICITAWQFAIFAVLFLSHDTFFTVFSFLPLFGLIIVAFLWPDIVGTGAVLSQFKRGAKVVAGITTAIGIEVSLGIYFSIIPISVSVKFLVPVIFLIVVAMILFSGGDPEAFRKTMRRTLATVFVFVTIYLVLMWYVPTATKTVFAGGGPTEKNKNMTKADSILTNVVNSWFTSAPKPQVLAASAAVVTTTTPTSQPTNNDNDNEYKEIYISPTGSYTLDPGENIIIELKNADRWTGYITAPDSFKISYGNGDDDFIECKNANGQYEIDWEDDGNTIGPGRFQLRGIAHAVIEVK